MSQQNTDLVAYCGLYCGDCLMHKGEVADLARDLRKKLREAKFETCPKLEFLRAVHGEAHLKNLRNIRKRGVQAFVAGPRYW